MAGDRKMPERFFILICAIGAMAILSSTMSKNPVLNPFAESLGTPVAFMGFVAAASTLPGVLISLPAGSLSDVLGRGRVLLMSSIVFCTAPFLYVFVSSWWQLILVRFYHGFATAVFIPVARAAIAERYPSRRGERISTFTSATIVGRSIAPFLGGLILSTTVYDFRALYLAVGSFGSTALLMTLVLSKGKDANQTAAPVPALMKNSQEKRARMQGWREVSRNIGVLVASSVDAASYYVYGALEFFLTGYLKNVAHLDPTLIGTLMAMQLALIPIVNPFMGRLSDKVGRRIPIVLGLLISGLPLVAIPYMTEFLVLAIVSVTYGLGFSMVSSSTPPLVGDMTSKEFYGTAMGFLATVMDIGQLLGPIITGVILATFGYSGSFFSLAAVLLGLFVFFSVSQRYVRLKNDQGSA